MNTARTEQREGLYLTKHAGRLAGTQSVRQNPVDHTSYSILHCRGPSLSPSILSCGPSSQKAFPSGKGQVIMVPVTSSRQKRDHIVWTDLIFRIPSNKPQTEVPKKEARRHTSTAVTSNLQACGSGCQMGKEDRQMKPLHRRMDSVQDEEAEEAKEPSPPPSHAKNAPSPPGDLVLQEKHQVKRILVDLRSILENVIDPSEEGSEERGSHNGAHSPSELGDSSSLVPVPSEEAEEKDPTNDRRPSSNAGDPSSEEHKTETTTMDPEDGQADRDFLRLQVENSGGELSLAAKTSRIPKEIWSPPGEIMPLWRNNSPAAQPSQPNLTIPTSSPTITPQQRGFPEAESTTDLVGPTSPSPDFQLPTQLLLQRLQETTTSKNHVLIMQVLRSLREELLVESSDSDDGDKRKRLPELPMGNPPKHQKPQTRTRKPVAPKRRLGKLIWCSRTAHAADLGQKAPNL